jgi:hypothetical protein
LVETIGPAPALQRAPGELVDDLHLAVGDQIVLVPLVKVFRRQGLGQLVDVVDGDGVVDVVDADRLLHLLDPGLEGNDRLLLLVDLVVLVSGQCPGDGGELVVELCGLVRRARDDQRSPRLVDENGVDLVDDGEHVAPLGHRLARARHVVAQVVEPELVVRAVGDVRRVGGPFAERVVDVGADATDRQSEPAVHAPHPLGVAGGEVLVHRHQVHAPPVQRVEVAGQGGDERLALTRLHFGDPAEVQRHASHELHVEVALAEHTPRRLADDRVGLDEEVVEGLAILEPLLELHRLVGELVVAEPLQVGFEGSDEGHQVGQPPHLLAFAGAQNLREHAHGRPILPAPKAGEPTDRPHLVSGCVRLTWSLTPHSPAARVTHRHRRHGDAAPHPTAPHWRASPRLRPPPTAGSAAGRTYL